MSFSISLPADATTMAPIRNTGTMQHEAGADAQRVGDRADDREHEQPGRIHSAATANPNERIFGGIASESAAKIGGTMSTTIPVTTALGIDGDHEVRAERERGPRGGDGEPDDGDEPGEERRALHEQAA